MGTDRKTGRNDPCPCGSGEKYKKCCMQKELRPDLTQQEWNTLSDTLTQKLIAYLDRPKFDADYSRAFQLFFPDSPVEDPAFLDDYEHMAFYDYLINHHRLDSTGRTIIGEFLEERRIELSPEERTLLKDRLSSRYSIYEVQEVYPDEGLLLIDLFQDDVREVHDVSGSQHLLRWDVLAASISKVGEQHQISGNAILIPRDMADWVQSTLLEEYHRHQEHGGQLDFNTFLKDRMYLIHNWMVEQMEAPLSLVNREGEEMMWGTARYHVINRSRIFGHTQKHPMFSDPVEEGDAQVITWWLQDDVAEELGYFSKDSALSSIFGTLRFTGEQMAVEVNSELRLAVARDYLEDVLEEHLEFIDESIQSFQDLMQQYDTQPTEAQEPAMDPDLQEGAREAVRQYQSDYYYNDWIYQSLPALGGLSPVEAYTRDPDKLENLLKTVENQFLRSGDRDTYPDIDDLKAYIAAQAEQRYNPELEEFYRRWEQEIGGSLAEMALLRFEISRDQTPHEFNTLAFDDAIIYRAGEGFQFGYVESVEEDQVMVILLEPTAHPVSQEDILTVLDKDETAEVERYFEDYMSQTELTLQMAQEFNLQENESVLMIFSALILAIFQMEDCIFDIIDETTARQIGFDIVLQPTPAHYVIKTNILVLPVPEICAILLGIDEEVLNLQQTVNSDVQDLKSRSAFCCIYYTALALYSLQHNRRLRNLADHRFRGLLEHLFQQKYDEVLHYISPVMDSLEDITELNLRSLYDHITEEPSK